MPVVNLAETSEIRAGEKALYIFTSGTTTASIMLVKYDVDEDEMVSDSSGQLVESKPGEPGLLIAEFEGRYTLDGYQDEEATNSKILTDVKKPGDR